MEASDFLEAMRAIVRPSLCLRPDARGCVRLEEQDRDSTIRPTIIEHAAEALVLKLDACVAPGQNAGERLFPLLEDDEGLRKHCDYVIFAVRRGGLVAVLLELKSSNARGAPRQLQNTAILLQSLILATRLHRSDYEAPQLAYRGIILTNTARYPKGKALTYDTSYRLLPDFLATTLPAGQSYFLPHFCS